MTKKLYHNGEISQLINDAHYGPVNDCWEWPGGYNRKGDAIVKVFDTDFSVRRQVYLHHVGRLRDNQRVYTTCENRKCFNFRHLRVAVVEQPDVRRFVGITQKTTDAPWQVVVEYEDDTIKCFGEWSNRAEALRFFIKHGGEKETAPLYALMERIA